MFDGALWQLLIDVQTLMVVGLAPRCAAVRCCLMLCCAVPGASVLLLLQPIDAAHGLTSSRKLLSCVQGIAVGQLTAFQGSQHAVWRSTLPASNHAAMHRAQQHTIVFLLLYVRLVCCLLQGHVGCCGCADGADCAAAVCSRLQAVLYHP